MKLKSQLLVVSLVMLFIPWAGCQFVKEVEGVLRHGQTQSLKASANAIASSLTDKLSLIYFPPSRYKADESAFNSLFVARFDSDIVVDGYDDGWPDVSPHVFENDDIPGSQKIALRLGLYQENYYLYFSITDSEVIYHNPTLPTQGNGDRVVLVMGGHHSPSRQYLISNSAPGNIVAKTFNAGQQKKVAARVEYGISGVWQDTADGYDLEIKIPRALMDHRFGFSSIDERGANGPYSTGGFANVVGNLARDAGNQPSPLAPWIVQPNIPLTDSLAVFKEKGLTLKIIDRFGWTVADVRGSKIKTSALNPPSQTDNQSSHWFVKRLFRIILATDSLPSMDQFENDEVSFSASQRKHASIFQPNKPGRLERADLVSALNGESVAQYSKSLLSVTAPIYNGREVIGALLVEQSSEEFLSLADNAFGRLLYSSFVVMSIIGFGLLSYASLLSWRIKKLSDSARDVIGSDGVLKSNFPVSAAKDELGDLSRNYAQLIYRVKQSSDYLRSLARTLSHELRTPIAIVRSSLDNLENEPLSEDGVRYAARAKEGVERLSFILTAMSEANHVEASIEHSERVEFDLFLLLAELMQAYQSVYADFNFQFEGIDIESVEIEGADADAGVDIHDAAYEPRMMWGVPELVVQMLDKIMDNAASFCPKGGMIKFILLIEASGYRLTLANEGPLLPKEMLGQLFDSMVSVRNKTVTKPKPLQRNSSKENKTEETHLGLGLYIARLIAEFHGGSIHAANLEDGRGVKFEVTLAAGAAG
ncbi:MAG: hypothetical protein COB51_08900 [Moraxellaceae bacterium]|nr:MAG: hypothetical protein COB51_08900 [Moraxellaceae bacterium]